jgi:type IV pilus assembly protein PilO
MAVQVLDKLNRIPLWQKAAVLLVLCALIPLAFQIMVWQPIEIQVAGLKSQLQELDRKYKEQKAVADDLVTFQQNTKKLEEDLRQALTQLPREKEIPSLLRDIYTLGKKSGILFKSFTPQAEANRSLYSEVPIKLSLSGSYHEVAVFFDRISKLSRIVNISDLNVTIGKSEETDVTLNIECTATTFVFNGSKT